ncbi:hypothetical protein [Ammoniphilus sp. YIM 78166]|uniref:hypothetical protein n=1 Tax=Ammoniphilus sp. YIM 78166 TaxID=1644106 RepID=UPI00106F2E61|nr:hypothetical protein [Ammoniphilus sp. YIM 78166]
MRDKQKMVFLFFIMLTLLTGCSLFQASPEEVEQYKHAFIDMVDKAAVEAENGQKVLAEIRERVDKEGEKKTKAQNTIINGVSISKAIKDDFIRAQIPSEMEPIREKLVLSLTQRIEAYDQLFKYYDFLDVKYRDAGDQLLEQSLQLFEEGVQELEQYRH